MQSYLFESKRHISQENEKLVANMGWDKISSTQIQTVIFHNSENHLSLSIINFIRDYYDKDILNDDESDGVFEGGAYGINFTENMMKYCNMNNCNCILCLKFIVE